MQNLLVISAVGENRRGLVDELSTAIRDCGCGIADSRMTVLGKEFAVVMLVSASWNAIAKLENTLPRLQSSLELSIVSRRTEAREAAIDKMPYAVEVVSADNPGVVNEIAHFFTVRDIDIEDVYTGTYKAVHTGTPMFSLHMTISVPTNTSIATLRGEFIEFCDHLNLDSIMEPVK
jgi:glycine cleavage system transcriptional repressor